MECTIMKIYSYFHIYRCKNRKSQEVLWIRWYKLQTIIDTRSVFPAVERLPQMFSRVKYLFSVSIWTTSNI
jgi:hypothetical protein